MHWMHRNFTGDLKQPKKDAVTAKNSLFRAPLKPLQKKYGPHRSQKYLKYMPVPGRYLREIFECMRYIKTLIWA